MKTIGIIGGMSWESTAKYYQWLNLEINKKLGGLCSAKIVLSSLNFDEIEKLQASGQWEDAGRILAQHAVSLEKAGADFIVLATNTMHKVCNFIEDATSIPFLHIADATADCILAKGLNTIGLLGTSYTMEQDFYSGLLTQRGIDVITPDAADRKIVNEIIFGELCKGEIKDCSKAEYIRVANALIDKGAEGIILGCTEISMLICQKDFTQPVFDTTKIHVDAAVRMALAA